MKIRSITYFFLTFLMLFPLMGCANADDLLLNKPSLSASQAIAKAALFCRHADIKITQPGSATFPTAAGSIEETYWQPRWRVTFAGEADIDVVDATGIISRFENTAYESRHDLTPAGQAMPEDEAVQLATRDVTATGLSQDIKFSRASQSQLGTPPLATTNEWEVFWQRVSGDVPYRHQHIGVGLDAQTGELKSLFIMFPSPPTQSGITKISRQQAYEVARQELLSAGFSEKPFQSAELEIVRISTASLGPDAQKRSPGVARIVWSCNFKGSGRTDNVWVDAETGQVVGGESYEQSGTHNPALSKSDTVLNTLRSADKCWIETMNSEASWSIVPSSSISKAADPNLFILLRSLVHEQQVGPAGKLTYRLAISTQSRPTKYYAYFPETGTTGGGDDWVVLPSVIKLCLNKEILQKSAK